MKRWPWVAGAIVLMSTGTWAYGQRTTASVAATPGPISDRIPARGLVDARDGVAEVRALVDGQVRAVVVNTGDEVRAGELLAELEPESAEAELAQRQAETRALTASMGSVVQGTRSEERASMEAEARAAQYEWELAMARSKEDDRLFQAGSLSQSARDASIDVEKVKRALWERAQAQAELARAGGRPSDVAAARERVVAAGAAAEQARRHLERTRIVSPIAGRVIARQIDPGDTVVAHAAATLFEIADVSRTYLRIEVEELDAARVEVGLSVKVSVPGGAGVGRAKISRVSPRLQRRTIDVADARVRADGLVRAAWLEWEGRAPALPLGLHVDASIELPPRQADIVLPRGAVTIRDGRAIVKVPYGPWTSERTVELGVADDHYIEVKGIQAGTRVVVASP